MDLLKGSKVGQKIVSLANQARNYFNDFTCQNKQVLANTLYDILDDSSDVAKAAAKRRIFSGGDAGEEFLKEMFGGRQQAYFKQHLKGADLWISLLGELLMNLRSVMLQQLILLRNRPQKMQSCLQPNRSMRLYGISLEAQILRKLVHPRHSKSCWRITGLKL